LNSARSGFPERFHRSNSAFLDGGDATMSIDSTFAPSAFSWESAFRHVLHRGYW
jgi:hypothetical protein